MTRKNRFDYSHAIATAYRSYEFRSRLEVKWAHFFDLCGWQWSYEPLDLPGWIPDFIVGEARILVEIKPAYEESELVDAIEKIEASGYRDDVILLGADPAWLAGSNFVDAPHFGWVSERHVSRDSKGNEEWQRMTSDLHFGVTEGNGKFGLCPLDGGWDNKIWRLTGKPARVDLRKDQIEKEINQRWAKACNVAKWVPVREPAE